MRDNLAVEPETRYARSGDVNIAYQVVGEGPFDLVHIPPFLSHVELSWQRAQFGALLRSAKAFASESRCAPVCTRANASESTTRWAASPSTSARAWPPAGAGEVLVSSTVERLAET